MGGKRTVSRLEPQAGHHLDRRDQEGEGLSTSSPGGSEDIPSFEERRDGSSLDLGHVGETHGRESSSGRFREVET